MYRALFGLYDLYLLDYATRKEVGVAINGTTICIGTKCWAATAEDVRAVLEQVCIRDNKRVVEGVVEGGDVKVLSATIYAVVGTEFALVRPVYSLLKHEWNIDASQVRPVAVGEVGCYRVALVPGDVVDRRIVQFMGGDELSAWLKGMALAKALGGQVPEEVAEVLAKPCLYWRNMYVALRQAVESAVEALNRSALSIAAQLVRQYVAAVEQMVQAGPAPPPPQPQATTPPARGRA